MEIIKLSDNVERLILNISEDNCPICNTPLKEVGFSWNIMHGEASSSCCGATYQIKSWYVDPEKNNQDIIDFSNSLDNPDIILFKILNEWIEPIQKAREILNEKYINNNVAMKAKEIKLKS